MPIASEKLIYLTKCMNLEQLGTKHLKALRYCNRIQAVKQWAKSQHNIRVSFTCAENEFNKQVEAAMKTANYAHIYKSNSLPMERLNSNSVGIIERQPSKKMVSNQFKMSVGNTGSNSDSQFTRLVETKSGTLVMELDQRMVEAIEKKTHDSPFVFVSLKNTDSGHLVLDFDNNDDVVSDKQRVTLLNTQSGTKHLEIHRSVLNIITDTQKVSKECQSILKTEPLYLLYDEIEQSSVEDTKNIMLPKPSTIKTQIKNDVGKSIDPKCVSLENISDLITYSSTSISKSVALSAFELLHDYSFELQELFENGDVIITLQIKSKSRLHEKMKAVMTKSPSGSIGAFLLKLESLDNIISNNNDYPVCLSKTKSSTYVVNVDQRDDAISNGVLKKSISGIVMLIPTRPQLNMINSKGVKCDQLFKIKVAGYKDYPLQLIKHAVLKSTQSNNFVIKFDEEFDNPIEETMQNYVGKEKQCFVFLKKTLSGFLIDLNSKGLINPQKLNALLFINEWGSIKVLLHGHVFKRIDTDPSKRSSISSVQIFGDLLYKIRPASSTEFHRIHLKKSKQINEKTVSDTQLLYDRVKVNLKISKTMLSSPSNVLKKTESGKYPITLSKDGKKEFINNLINFLAPNKAAVPPMLFRNLNNNCDVEERYGTLKITSSGNFYIVVDSQSAVTMDTKLIKNVTQNELCNTKSLSLVWPVDKAVTTNCDCIDDSDVRELVNLIDQSNCWNNSKKDSNETISIGNACASGTLCIQEDKVSCQHTIQKQTCVEGPHYDDNNAKNDKSEFYEMYNPTKLIKNGEFESYYSGEPPQRERECWNSFDYLPPQLPPFLQNVYYQ